MRFADVLFKTSSEACFGGFAVTSAVPHFPGVIPVKAEDASLTSLAPAGGSEAPGRSGFVGSVGGVVNVTLELLADVETTEVGTDRLSMDVTHLFPSIL